MRLARARTEDGVVSGEYEDGAITTDDGERYEVGDGGDGSAKPGDDAALLAPCTPTALYCVGRNYAATLDQMGYDRPERPDWFIKSAVSVHPPNAPIEHPEWTDELTYAGELAAVIDEECADLDEDEVDDAVRGYTIMNDLDALDQDGRTARKAFDGSAPLGPWIETDVEPTEMEMTTHVSGEQRQAATTEQMLFGPREIVAVLSDRYTFQPGDIVAFGSPANPGLIEPGDEIEMWYEGIGTLRNEVVAAGE